MMRTIERTIPGAIAAAPPESTGVPTPRPRVLCVDDERMVTASIERVLRRSFEVVCAQSAAAGLACIEQGPPFAVVISDFQMPGMDGAAFLKQVRRVAPDATRVLLTGRSDLTTAVAAINQGQIYRFMAKPPAPDMLLAVVTAASEQHRLAAAERELLEQTLHGSVKALMSLLALAQPAALGRTSRVKRHVTALAEQLDIPERWSIEIAALLSQVGCVTLPAATMEKFISGEELSDAEAILVDRLPSLAETLIAGIPRLDEVRAILRYQDTCFDGQGAPDAGVAGDAIPLGARVLKVVLDLDLMEMQGMATDAALALMEERSGWYDPVVLDAGHALWDRALPAERSRQILLPEAQVGMIFADNVISPDGLLRAARGQDVTPALLDRIGNDWSAWSATHWVSIILPSE
jgi:response regulator RpfG family c-di-GMP phosphodiesterase